ncbi:MAG: hypothetical protein U0166_02565 [Acidobacteriota bacterium]
MHSTTKMLFAALVLWLSIPGARACDGILGNTVAGARDTMFFTWFQLDPVATTRQDDGGDLVAFRTRVEDLRDALEVDVRTDAAGRVRGVLLFMRRSMVEDRADGQFAAAMCAALIRHTPIADRSAAEALAGEIQDRFQEGLRPSPIEASDLPLEASEAYRAYRGEVPRAMAKLGRSAVCFDSTDPDWLVVGVLPTTEEASAAH